LLNLLKKAILNQIRIFKNHQFQPDLKNLRRKKKSKKEQKEQKEDFHYFEDELAKSKPSTAVKSEMDKILS